jgi:hypothetical protein
MTRPWTEFIFSQAMLWSDRELITGRGTLPCKLLSEDVELGELTAIVKFPPGWSSSFSSSFQEEIYVLEGGLTIGEVTLYRDGYARLPSDVTHDWSVSDGAVCLIFLNQAQEDDETEAVVLDTLEMVWDRSGVPEQLSYMGIARKALFVDRENGRHRTWLLTTAPQIAPTGPTLAVETHPCAEELFMLAGDIIGPHGSMTAGAYFWRPRDTFHGPFGSRDGSLAILRFRHGVQDVVFHSLTKPFSFDAPYRPELPPGSATLVPESFTKKARF